LSFQSLTISGALTFETTTARSITVSGNVLIDNTGSFQTGATGTITTHALSIGGDLTNNGILDFSTNNNAAGASITFTGASNNTFGGSGTKTDILTLTVNKGTNSTYILTLSPAQFSVKGITSNASTFLTLTKGTIHIAGTFTFSSVVTIGTAAYTVCNSTAGFWLDNPNVVVLATSGSVTADGLFKLSQGIFSVGSSASHSFIVSTATDFQMSGGTLNVASRMRALSANSISPLNFTMSGGTLNICTQGNATSGTASFSVKTKNFTMSGGNIIINKPSTYASDYSLNVTQTANITGGTLTCSPTSSGNFYLEGYMPALVIDGAGDIGTLASTAKVYGDVTINNGAILDLNNNILYLNQGNVTNNGTIKSSFTASGNTSQLAFTATTTQSYNGTGVFGTSAAPIAILSVNNSNALTLSSTNNNLHINNLYIFSGNINNANQLEIGNSLGLTSLIQYGSSSTATASGNLDAAPTFNIGSGGLAVLYCKETNSRTIGYEIPPSRVLNQLTLMGNTVTLADGDLNVASYLQFFSGKINLGNYNLILESTVSLTGADNNGYVITNGTGSLTQKSIGSTTTLFPVGTTTTYDPASITNAGTADDFTVNVSANLDAFVPMPTKYIQRQWNISEATVGGSDVSLSLTCAAGVPTTNFDAASPIEIGHYKSTNVWERIAATMNSSVATANNVTSFSPAPFVIINQSAILPVELIDFKGFADGKQNILRWSTASEKDAKCFIIERSNNSENFKSLDLVATIGHSNQPQFYQWIDNAPNPLSMYRLKIMDLNGSFDYSKVISVENAEGNAMTLLPNFGSDEWTVHLTNVPMGAGTLSIFDMQGKLFQTQNIDIQNITTDIKLSINNLLNGNYILICNISGQILSKKFIKI
jgi:hypothetical protein